MENTDFKIGLAFSGGGFRASAFSLGVLSYLNEVQFEDATLLHSVYALSTVSGGTITGARYALGIKKGESFEEIYECLYRFMAETDLINISLSNVLSKRVKNDKRNKSLITAFADAYNTNLFNDGKFGTLLSDDTPIHLKHISFNATEFENAVQFRFQKSEGITNAISGEAEKGIVGNYYIKIPEDLVKDIRMADILAASSCFPGGFEPLLFPNDFALSNTQAVDNFLEGNQAVGLMDGGIVDNQGIEPLLLAEQRMKRNRPISTKEEAEQNEFDLLIISDVTSPYMDTYEAKNNQRSNFLARLNFKQLIVANFIVLLGSIIGIIYSFNNELQILNIVFSALITINLFLYLLLAFIKKMPRKFHVPAAFLKPLSKLLRIKFADYGNMIFNRTNSLLKMTNDVFLKHIRRLNYNKIYQDKQWKNRRIMNAIYELRAEEEKLQKKIESGKMNPELIPSDKLQKVASTAASMGTTLWFTKQELKEQDMLNSIIAAGQFTMCWNLLDYIQNIKKDAGNTNQKHAKLLQMEPLLLQHWQRFNKDPFWLVNNTKA